MRAAATAVPGGRNTPGQVGQQAHDPAEQGGGEQSQRGDLTGEEAGQHRRSHDNYGCPSQHRSSADAGDREERDACHDHPVEGCGSAGTGQPFGQCGKDCAEVTVQHHPLQRQRDHDCDARGGDRLEKLPESRSHDQVGTLDHGQDEEPDPAGPADQVKQNPRQRATGSDEILFETSCGPYRDGAQTH